MNNNEEYVVISNTNIACNIDFDQVEAFHINKGADITVLTYRTDDVNSRKLIITSDKNDRITDMRYAVASDAGKQLCNLNIYFIKRTCLSLSWTTLTHTVATILRKIFFKQILRICI